MASGQLARRELQSVCKVVGFVKVDIDAPSLGLDLGLESVGIVYC
jgi:hypothetical protein